MRLDIPDDIPYDLPRRRQPETPPLAPSPLELRREELREQMEHPRKLNLPRQPQAKKHSAELPQPDVRRDVAHDHALPRRTRRNELAVSVIGPPLRQEEIKALGEIGRFRVVATRDLAITVYSGHNHLARDLRFLEQNGLVRAETVNARRDGRGGKVERIEVVTLTEEGRKMARRLSGLPVDQQLYSGLVKPREVEHDSQIYRAYLKEAERIEKQGGERLRVRLDFELKSQVQKAIHAERKADPERDIDSIKQQVAAQL